MSDHVTTEQILVSIRAYGDAVRAESEASFDDRVSAGELSSMADAVEACESRCADLLATFSLQLRERANAAGRIAGARQASAAFRDEAASVRETITRELRAVQGRLMAVVDRATEDHEDLTAA